MKLPRFDDPMLKPFAEMLPYGRPVAGAQELGADHAGLFRRHPAHPARRPDPQKAMDEAAEEIQALLEVAT